MTTWLTLQEAADYLKVSKETMYRMVYSKRIPRRRIGVKLYRFSTEDLDRAVIGGVANGRRKKK